MKTYFIYAAYIIVCLISHFAGTVLEKHNSGVRADEDMERIIAASAAGVVIGSVEAIGIIETFGIDSPEFTEFKDKMSEELTLIVEQ